MSPLQKERKKSKLNPELLSKINMRPDMRALSVKD
jgi:hypothetical protein